MRGNVILRMSVFIITALLVCTGCKKGGTSSETPEQPKIVVLGAVTGEELPILEECFDAFEDETGIRVIYEGSNEFENLVTLRVDSGNAPDLAMFSQRGSVIRLANQGKLVKVDVKTVENINQNYGQGWIDQMTIDGIIYGVVHRVNTKSLVWYPKKAWAEMGWKIPDTWEELEALCEQMAAEGETPWAVGMESGGATGWVATDWMEDIILRTSGPAVYDKWVDHDILFSDVIVKNAAEVMGKMWLSKGYVYGGPGNIPTTHYGEAPKVLFETPPKAWMHKQGNFIINFFPEHIQDNLDEEVGVFSLPRIDPNYGKPVVGEADLFVAFKDRPEVHKFMYYLSTGKSGEIWAAKGGALFAHKDQNLDAYSTDIEKQLAQIMMDTEIFRLDASDLMPSQVGSGSFWNEMIEYVNGKDLEMVLEDIDSSWP